MIVRIGCLVVFFLSHFFITEAAVGLQDNTINLQEDEVFVQGKIQK